MLKKTAKKSLLFTRDLIVFGELKTWPISDENFINWISPDVCINFDDKRGCAIDALTFLKIIPQDVGYYFSQIYSQIKKYESHGINIGEGLHISDFFQLLNRYNNNDKLLFFNIYELWNQNTLIELHDYLFRTLEINHTTIFTFLPTNNKISGHTTIICKTNNERKQLIVIDPQNYGNTPYSKLNSYGYEYFYDYFGNTLVDGHKYECLLIKEQVIFDKPI